MLRGSDTRLFPRNVFIWVFSPGSTGTAIPKGRDPVGPLHQLFRLRPHAHTPETLGTHRLLIPAAKTHSCEPTEENCAGNTSELIRGTKRKAGENLQKST